jgi:succinyl-diaminopimelate desuccinylase
MDYREILECDREEMTEALRGAIRIKSVGSDPVRGRDGRRMPFGKGVDDAYRYFLELGEKLGFTCFDADGYGGHIEMDAGKGAEVFGIACHADVVPEGEGWEHDPYGAEEDGGFIYGRGTTDDKGPLISALYALKAVRDAGYEFDRSVRIIIGLDEETGSSGMADYLEAAGAPDLGITPDGDFPAYNGEMGIMNFSLARKLKKHTVKDGLVLRKLESGTAPNIVPDRARAVIAAEDPSMYGLVREKASAYAAETGYEVRTKRAGSSLSVETFGTAAHGSAPQNGLNAFSIMMDLLGRIQFAGEDLNDFIAFYNEHIGFETDGESLGCGLSDEESGRLILNVGTASFSEDIASCTINIRYPVTCTSDQVYGLIEKKTEGTEIGIVKLLDEKPLFVEADSPFIRTLMDAYESVTGDTSRGPEVSPGGTYAKSIPNTVAFGALFPGDEDRMHQPEERVRPERIFEAAEIYAETIVRLCCSGAGGEEA